MRADGDCFYTLRCVHTKDNNYKDNDIVLKMVLNIKE